MSQFSAALLSRALHLLEALLSPPRGRHSRTRLLGFRRRSTRVRRYAANPGPARRSAPHLPAAPAPPAEVLPADDVALVRPYYTAHEHSLAAAAEDADRAQADARARLARWTGGPVDPSAPPRIPAPRPMPPGDLLAPVAPRPAPARDPFVPPDLADLERAVRVWVARNHRREAGV
ncbi:hypothetical protein ACOQFV_22995 [Nocardiopsis changdeensis]|uniref:Uncharacterized protein n=1 Tax=Nocardiopsis changdeensis TaxID=2831969 RepID=A0ABX8BI81_9ACTN|nr:MULTISPECIES: hypothetical protein [Nocardiopsis]QUX21949.1 hypothetical protein KGD84_26870 [Nocardiopsis changdeensis]QYX37885.1 hypothetical protein K1J57_04265 [Nocardiopsis sp. MT53]